MHAEKYLVLGEMVVVIIQRLLAALALIVVHSIYIEQIVAGKAAHISKAYT